MLTARPCLIHDKMCIQLVSCYGLVRAGLLGKFRESQVNRLAQELRAILFSRMGKICGGLQLSASNALVQLFHSIFPQETSPWKVLWNHGASLGIWNRNEPLSDTFSRGGTDRGRSSVLHLLTAGVHSCSIWVSFAEAVNSYTSVLCSWFGVCAMRTFIGCRAC